MKSVNPMWIIFHEILKLNYAFFQIPITLQKEVSFDQDGQEVSRCGFKIGGSVFSLLFRFTLIDLIKFWFLLQEASIKISQSHLRVRKYLQESINDLNSLLPL